MPFVLLLCLSSSHSQGPGSRAGSLFFFMKLNALIKPSDHLGRDKEVIPSSSLKPAASALCFAISCHWRTGSRYLTNLGLCLGADKCQSGVIKSQTSLWCYCGNSREGFKKQRKESKPAAGRAALHQPQFNVRTGKQVRAEWPIWFSHLKTT